MADVRIALAGSVSFSRRTLEGLIRNGANVVGVLALSPSGAASVSDYSRLDDLAANHGVPWFEFEKINHPHVINIVESWRPDLLFVVGLSQLVRPALLSIPSKACIGFHPTRLPEGRGRAPVVWLTFDGRPGAATFFVLSEEADAGPILVQEPFFVGPSDQSRDVIDRINEAIDRALDRWIPQMVAGEWAPVEQDHSRATTFGKRGPEDGLIDWNRTAYEIEKLVRAAGRPYPGAYSYYRGAKLVIWRSVIDSSAFRGVTARILDMASDGSFIVQTGSGLLRVQEYEFASANEQPKMTVGAKLGYAADDEIHLLRERIRALENRLATLEAGDGKRHSAD